MHQRAITKFRQRITAAYFLIRGTCNYDKKMPMRKQSLKEWLDAIKTYIELLLLSPVYFSFCMIV